ncbi:MAG: TM2 domain-containing protein [Alphaproteobacteria bacterium]|nr:TM2 domain-containing protein [Alphaproteobacteria bacterium]MBQ9235299.1 TM2 domain-containing protein [Alphaproteobacteria bacterium]
MYYRYSDSTHNGIVYIAAAFFLGCLGIHNFYAQYWKRGLAQLGLTIVSPYMMFIPLIFTALWATLEILFVDKSADGCAFSGNRTVIWGLRLGVLVCLVWMGMSADTVISGLDLQNLAEWAEL